LAVSIKDTPAEEAWVTVTVVSEVAVRVSMFLEVPFTVTDVTIASIWPAYVVPELLVGGIASSTCTPMTFELSNASKLVIVMELPDILQDTVPERPVVVQDVLTRVHELSTVITI